MGLSRRGFLGGFAAAVPVAVIVGDNPAPAPTPPVQRTRTPTIEEVHAWRIMYAAQMREAYRDELSERTRLAINDRQALRYQVAIAQDAGWASARADKPLACNPYDERLTPNEFFGFCLGWYTAESMA